MPEEKNDLLNQFDINASEITKEIKSKGNEEEEDSEKVKPSLSESTNKTYTWVAAALLSVSTIVVVLFFIAIKNSTTTIVETLSSAAATHV